MMDKSKIEWLVENHLILLTAYNWDVDGYTEDILKMVEMIDQSDRQLVHILLDMSKLEHYPTKIPAIVAASKPLGTHERLGWVTTVINNKIISFLSQMAPMVFKVRYKTFEDIEEAKAFLISTDPSLTSIP